MLTKNQIISLEITAASSDGNGIGRFTDADYPTGLVVFVTNQVVDMVVYRFDFSKVALIITKEYEQVAKDISAKLDRGATFLYGQGTYSGKDTKVVLTAVKKQQLAELKELVVALDPDAFIIVQEAHQVLGDGFSRYTKDAL